MIKLVKIFDKLLGKKNKYKLINYPKHYPADGLKEDALISQNKNLQNIDQLFQFQKEFQEHWIIIILVRKNNSKISIVLFAYGFMGNSTFQNLIKDNNFSIKGLILPKKYLYFEKYKKQI